MCQRKKKHRGHEITLAVGLISGQAGVCFNSKLFSGLILWGFNPPAPHHRVDWDRILQPSACSIWHHSLLLPFSPFFTHFIPHLCVFHSPPPPFTLSSGNVPLHLLFYFFPIGREHINLQFNYGMAVGWFGLHPRLTFTQFPWRKELHFHLRTVWWWVKAVGGKGVILSLLC